jgi:serine/threonine-protein kinase
LCARATQQDPELRPARARDLAEAIERFLDGDRDQALRVDAARTEAQRAQELMATVQEGAEERRSDAIRAVGRALALDPQNRVALETLLQLLTEPPTEVPEAAQRAIAEQTQDHDRAAAAGAVAIYVGTALLYAGFVAWMGVRSYGWLTLTVGGFLVAALLSWADSRDTGTRYEFGVLLASVVGIVGSSRMLGPLVLAPTFALGNTLGFALTPRKKRRLAFIAVGCLSFLAPAFAEWAGWLPHSYRFHDGVMSVVPQMHALPPTATITALVVITMVSTIGAAMFVGDMRDALSDAEKKLQLQAWQLSQLVPAPEEPQAGAEPTHEAAPS